MDSHSMQMPLQLPTRHACLRFTLRTTTDEAPYSKRVQTTHSSPMTSFNSSNQKATASMYRYIFRVSLWWTHVPTLSIF